MIHIFITFLKKNELINKLKEEIILKNEIIEKLSRELEIANEKIKFYENK